MYPQATILLAAALALFLSVAGHLATHAVTMAHEGGHALVGVLMGGKLDKITFSGSKGGSTFVSVPNWLGNLLTDLAGYLGPSMFGLVGVGLLRSGNPAEVLWVTIVLLALLLFFSGNLLLVVKVVAFGGLLLVVEHYATSEVQTIVVLTWVWWLLIGAVADAVELIGITVSGDSGSDAYHLYESTWIPGPIWGLVFLAGTLTALYVGGHALLDLRA